jgi:hypothetical protein
LAQHPGQSEVPVACGILYRGRDTGFCSDDVTAADWVVQTTTYFREQVLRKRSYLQLGWIERVVSNPERRSVQEDGRIRFWGWVPELGHWLRVVTLDDGETVHNAFPDRNFDPGLQP